MNAKALIATVSTAAVLLAGCGSSNHTQTAAQRECSQLRTAARTWTRHATAGMSPTAREQVQQQFYSDELVLASKHNLTCQ